MENDHLFVAMKLDIVNSRKYHQRDEIQKKFIKITQKDANMVFKNSVKAKFIVTHGDELQVLLKVTPEIVDIINFFMDEMHPIKIRIGIGIGTLNTAIRQVAIGMDGPAFYLAKEAMDIAHDNKKYVVVKGTPYIDERIINTILDLMFAIREDWSDTQRKIISYVRQGLVQETIAGYLKISQPAVSKHLSNAKWKAYEEGENTLRQLFRNIEPTLHHLEV